MRVLVACEFSGVVRDAFRANGHDAWSCDLLTSEGSSINHIKGNVIDLLYRSDYASKIDLLIAHPPCTYLAVSGARWFAERKVEQNCAVKFCEMLWDLDIPRIAIENPIGVLGTRSGLGKASQIIQPWMFGHGEVKATCLWLKNLPKLVPTNIVEGRHARVHREPPSPDRWKNRSRTLKGIAAAMASQWGALDLTPEAPRPDATLDVEASRKVKD